MPGGEMANLGAICLVNDDRLVIKVCENYPAIRWPYAYLLVVVLGLYHDMCMTEIWQEGSPKKNVG